MCHGLDEVASGDGLVLGSVAIGTLPYSRTTLTPRAIIHVLDQHPQLDISTREGPYPMLEASLRNGDLDFIIGAIRTSQHTSDLKAEVLFQAGILPLQEFRIRNHTPREYPIKSNWSKIPRA